jgi:uncharacterized membrane protein YphA (DoxX/SURF4 family)
MKRIPALDNLAHNAVPGWSRTLLTLVRWFLGLDYVINGLNWFHKIITPYPSRSDFVDFLPPANIVGAMIDNGVLFHLAKATELVTGLALLADVFVPLALVLAMTVTVPVFAVDALNPHPHLRAMLMGTGALVMNLFLLSAYFNHYRSMLTLRSSGHIDPRATAQLQTRGVDRFASMLRPLMPALGVVSALLGLAVVTWLLVMVAQYVMDPLPISAVRPLTPR